MATVRLPRFEVSSTSAFIASKGTAVEEGCTIAQVLLFMMAWYWFSPVCAWQSSLEPFFFLQSKSLERKYQQRGRCMMLPPSVAILRTCGVAAWPAASERAEYLCWIPG